jgi:RNA polymerase sigma factor (sigma-70 family)
MNLDTSIKTARVEELLAHADWLRRLAGRLVGPGEGEDLVQETWTAALRSPPRGDAEQAGPWLARVVRNLASNRRRTRGRAARVIVPQTAAVPDAAATAPSPEELLERARTERRLADRVLALDEPYRSAILLRYYEGKSSAEMARALGIPAGTVRWRLSEAIEQLRVQLDAEHGGDRARWRALLLPIAHLAPQAPAAPSGPELTTPAGRTPRPLPVPATAGLLASGKKVLVGTLIGLTLLGGLGLLAPGGGGDDRGGNADDSNAGATRSPVTSSPPAQPAPTAGARLEGQVLDPEGRPVAGARVTVSAEGHPLQTSPGEGATQVSGADGTFRLEGLAPGRYVATALDDRWAGAFSSPLPLQPGGLFRVTLRLTAGGETLHGQILDDGGGPIPGARVQAELGYPFMNVGPRRHETAADAQGRYRLRLPPREYVLKARAPGYAAAETTVALTRPLRRDLRLLPAARLTGQVVDRASGQPVADAVVRLAASHFGPGSPQRVRSDAAGQFAFDAIEPGSYQLMASHDRLVARGPGRSFDALESVEGIVLALEPGLSVGGRITDPRGQGLSGVELRVVSFDLNEGAPVASARTGADGSYRVDGLLAGGYRLMVDGDALGFAREERPLDLTPGPPRKLDLQLKSAPRLTGRVLGVDGQPARGVLVQPDVDEQARLIAMAPVLTDDDGGFAIAASGTDRLRLVAWAPGQGIARLTVEPAGPARRQPVQLRLEAGGAITGRVRFTDGAPAAGVSVSATYQAGPAVVYDSDTTDSAGRFAIGSLGPGRYAVQAQRKAGPYNLWTSCDGPEAKLVEVAANQQATAPDLVLARGGHRLAGVVLLPDGTPAAGARVVAARAAEGPSKPPGHRLEHAASAGPDGRFALPDVEAGPLSVWVTLASLPELHRTGVESDSDDLVLKLAPAASVEGSVKGSDGKPLSGFVVSLLVPERGYDGGKEVARTTGEGAFRLDGLAAGSYQLRVRAPDGGNAVQAVSLGTGERKTGLQLVVREAASVTGRVLSVPSGKPLHGARVEVGLGSRVLEAESDSDGRFTLPGVPAGETVGLRVMGPSHSDGLETVDLPVPAGARTVDVGAVRLLFAPDWQERWRTAGPVGMEPAVERGQIRVRAVTPGGAAARAGLVAGDTLQSVGGQPLGGLGEQATRTLLAHPPGTRLSLSWVTAAGQPRTAELVVPPK